MIPARLRTVRAAAAPPSRPVAAQSTSDVIRPEARRDVPHEPRPPRRVLPVVIAAQFAGTSMWFAGNAVLDDLRQVIAVPDAALGSLTSAVQLGFIVGTLIYAALLVSDRFSPSKVFLVSALLGASCNAAIALGTGWTGAIGVSDYAGVLALRFATGFFLAGIYPVGMKIAADWFAAGLGRALGYLVGALVLGTAFPHLLRAAAAEVPWQVVLVGTSVLAVAGGLAVWRWVPDGPYRKPSGAFRPGAIVDAFRAPRFRAAALGYFGHMWELFAFWAFVPVALAFRLPDAAERAVSLGSFGVIAVGSLGCVIGGLATLRVGSARVAAVTLAASGALCLASPLVFALPPAVFVLAMTVWGFAVVADSPQYSALVARYAEAESRGSALTIVNSIGFAITVPSIQLLTTLSARGQLPWTYLALAVGPILGLLAMGRLVAEGA